MAKKGLRRIQIEGDEQEYLLDNEGNIYNLQGEFVGTTGDEDEEDGGEAQWESESLQSRILRAEYMNRHKLTRNVSMVVDLWSENKKKDKN